MTVFSFTTQGMEAGYSDEGFFVVGETTKHEFDEREWVGHDLPRIRGVPIAWRVDIAGKNMWHEYAFSAMPVTERAEVLEEFWNEFGRPCAYFWKWNEEEFSLSYSLPPDPAFASFILGVMAAERELLFRCQGFSFANEGVVAPAPTVSGFLERKEPLFLLERPIIRVR